MSRTRSSMSAMSSVENQCTRKRRTTKIAHGTSSSTLAVTTSRGNLRAIALTLQSQPMLFTEIDHVAIAVNDLEAAIDYYRSTYGCDVEHREVVERDGFEEALLKVADSSVQ